MCMWKARATPSVSSTHLQYSPVSHCTLSELPVLINSSLSRDLGEVQAAPFLFIFLAFCMLFLLLALIKAANLTGLQFV